MSRESLHSLACKVSLTPLNYKCPVAENLNISTVQMFFSFCKHGITTPQTYPGAELAQFRALPPALDELEAGVLPKLVIQIFDRSTCPSSLFDSPNNCVTAFETPLSNHDRLLASSAKWSSQSGTGFSVLIKLHHLVLPKYFVSSIGVRCSTKLLCI